MKPTTINKLKEPQNQEAFQKAIDQIISELEIQADSREVVKEILADLKTKFELSPTLVRKLAKARFDDKMNELIEANSEIVALTQVLN